jgi:4-nitrophenyl phosphatase
MTAVPATTPTRAPIPAPARPRAFIFDLDGVLYRGEEAIDGAAETLARLRALADPAAALFFLTNNSTQARRDYVAKLTRLGMRCVEDEIVTSASATAAYLVSLGAAGRSVLCVGGPGIRDEMARAGMETVTTEGPEHVPVDYVVTGMDRQFNYHTLWRAQQAVLGGAVFIATNRDGQYPIENDQVVPGGGAMVAAIEACTDTTPVVIGKPETHGLRTILDRAGIAPHEALLIGDRLDTDVLCGNRLGVPTVLVLTGVTSEAKALDAPPEMRPSRIIADLRALP